MFDIGSFSSRDCSGISRRAFLQAGAALPFAGGLSALGQEKGGNPPRAKSVMLIWLGGGPSHLDLFDPKPKALAQYRGPFSAIQTRTPELLVSELLPNLAQRSHLYSVVQSNINYQGGHRPAGSIAFAQSRCYEGAGCSARRPTNATAPAVLDQIAHNVRWGLIDNLHSVPEDCDQRNERWGWMGKHITLLRR